jgi:Zn-dependent peptidase ImmA (M78 family)
MIYNFINDICDILNIPIPSVSFDTSHFSTDTMMAQVNSSVNTIYLKEYDKPNPDQLFSIAHELRHVWQIENYYDLYFHNYQTVDIIGVEKYNLQPAEVDANAFASIIMVDFFHLQPQYKGLTDSVISSIKNRINEIVIELSE